MAYALARNGTTFDHSAISTASPISAVISTTAARDLLVLCIGTGAFTAAPVFTLPAGWLPAVATPASTTGNSLIFYYPDCPAGITSVPVSWSGGGTGFMWALIMEFHDAAGTNPSPLDQTGSITNDTTTPVPVATSGAAAANDMAVSAFSGLYTTATKDSLNSSGAAGWSNNSTVGQAVKQLAHGLTDFSLNQNNPLGILTDSVTFTGPFNSAFGTIATFRAFTGPPPALLAAQHHRRPMAAYSRRDVAVSRGRF